MSPGQSDPPVLSQNLAFVLNGPKMIYFAHTELESRISMIHIVRQLFKAAHHGAKHASRIASSTLKPAAHVTPRAWMQAGRAHKHTASFWTKIAHGRFKFRT